MKVAIDISPLSSGHRVRGVGFYLKHLKSALEKSHSDVDFQFYTKIEEVKSADLVHLPYFELFTPSIVSTLSFPLVVTIHDLTPVKFPNHFPVGFRGKINWQINKRKAKNIKAIITDSESSKKDILKYLSYPEEKVHVVYLAAGGGFTPKKVTRQRVQELRNKYNLPEKFALYVGDVTWNKNVPRLIEACIQKKISLVLIGKAIALTDYDKSHPWNHDLVETQKLISSSSLVQALGFVDDAELADLYRLATVFTMPSLYEGFGLPVIEAMKSGCPVVTSEEGSLKEVGGDAAYYVDPYNTLAIGEGISAVFNSVSLQSELRKKGLEQSANFSWEKTARETIDVYKKCL